MPVILNRHTHATTKILRNALLSPQPPPTLSAALNLSCEATVFPPDPVTLSMALSLLPGNPKTGEECGAGCSDMMQHGDTQAKAPG